MDCWIERQAWENFLKWIVSLSIIISIVRDSILPR